MAVRQCLFASGLKGPSVTRCSLFLPLRTASLLGFHFPFEFAYAPASEFAIIMNDPQSSWPGRSDGWEDGDVDSSLKPVNSLLTARPVDMLLMPNTKQNCPRQYVWVQRFDDNDRPRPDGAPELAEMSFPHHHFLRFLRIFSIEHKDFEHSLYLRWEFEPNSQNNTQMWKVINLPRDIQEAHARNLPALMKRLHPVFVEAHNGLHFGRWIHDLCARSCRATALFVQTFGDVLVDLLF